MTSNCFYNWVFEAYKQIIFGVTFYDICIQGIIIRDSYSESLLIDTRR